jgi:hypothetical protein
MENLTELLRELAEKLGTTTEYLWEVMIRQAYISATLNLLYVIFFIVYTIAIWKVHLYLLKTSDDESYSRYDDYEENATIPMITCLMLWLGLAIGLFLAIPVIFYGYMNPEYWALQQILGKI